MKQKKAITLQLNWIFILIAGALILAFFFMVIQKAKTSSENKLSADVSIKLDSIFASAQQSTGTTFQIKTPPQLQLSFDSCAEQGKGSFSVGGVSMIKTKGVFAPNLIKSQRNLMLIQALDFSLPFKVMNLLYVTSPDVRYIFIAERPDDPVRDYFLETSQITMPNGTTIFTANDCNANFEDRNHYKVRFVFFYDPVNEKNLCASYFASMPNDDVTAVVFSGMDSISDFNKHGEVKFYKKSDDDKFVFASINENANAAASQYIGIESLIGAILSDNAAQYECSMKQAFEKLNAVSKVYNGKLESFKNNPLLNRCNMHYTSGQIQTAFDGIITNSASLSRNVESNKIGIVSQNAQSISRNNQLLQLYSCPMLY